ncbi:uroporphyrinogen decarboxylase/cobalamine-independent methonine synthase family protein [Corynebacterium glutamicum]|uniref:hypothetical protein n=1 Tax=Corynebacterium glutamicum TaxID=1718 RepID=UPI000941CD9A|nr:hypothetical protein [Corynebacterium glutamicum]OKX83821.1 hypothetical protein AUO96_13815 [Corynebacterium glutamicum]QDX75418.1 hypothetical protein AKL15_06495 [Corynebacterium glutamicum]QDX78185.1 hypothetical protein AKL16_06490 [Corynebacterium glutamicum]TWS35705.1 hypothetical protein AKJ20_05545 [Corynebacterium glutamicum]TWS35970.1 hypothetical protein AKJ19_03870 [Corynebacterium glutamicum]
MGAYGLGELPGKSAAEAADIIQGETGDLLHIPQLPARGLGADLIGRTVGLLDMINVDRGARSWVMSTRPSRLTHLTGDFLDMDLDACEETWGTGVDKLKIQVAGPWTLGARIELANGHRVLSDRGAMRDLTQALIAGIDAHARKVAGRFRAEVQVQIDEPELKSLIDGSLPGTSTFDIIPAVNVADASECLQQVFSSIEGPTYLNLTGQIPTWDVARGAGADTVQISMDQVRGNEHLDGFGETITSGIRLGLGITTGKDVVDELLERPRQKAVEVARFFDRLGVGRNYLVDAVDIHPGEDLVQGTITEAAQAYRMARVMSEMLSKDSGDL